MYIGDYLGRRALYSPDALAFVDAGKNPALRLTFAQANQRANKLANLFQSWGIGHGDRVAILARDGIEHLDCFFACSKLGAVHTAFNWRLHWRELQDLVESTQPKVLVFSHDFRESVSALLDEVAQGIDCVAHSLHIEGSGLSDSLHFETALQSSSDEPMSNAAVDKETIAALIFTGGTTGLPKAAQVSHRMIAWNTLNTVIHDLYHGDTYLNVFPMFHTGGMFVYTLPNVIMGGTSIFLRQFEPEKVLALIEQEAVTIFAAVPAMYQMLTQADNWESADLSCLRFCTSGGAPLPVPLVQQYTAEKGIRFKQGFGMTEFGPGIFALAPEDAIRKAGSIGRPNFFVEARVMKPEGDFAGPDQPGELVLKGPSYCSGYFGDPEATAQAVDADGYFHTGDIASYDQDSYFTIVDRKKDMFISGGENVYPVEIEKALYEHPAVHMCAVIGVPDERWGEVGLAYVVLKPGQAASEQELLQAMRARLAGYKVPKGVVFMDELPISAAGKVLKRELRAQ